MSVKSIIQIIILIIILIILGSVYFQYFSKEKILIEETIETKPESEKLYNDLEKKINELEEKNNELIQEIEVKIKQLDKKEAEKKLEEEKKLLEAEKKLKEEKKSNNKKNKIRNTLKDVEYLSTDRKGNKFKLLAKSAKSNEDDNNILDLDNVRSVITSDIRDPIYIVSDFAQYNTSNSNSKFYQNVIINYMDKEITCENFDIDMETNEAIAYNNVIVTDPKSTMKAGIITFDLETKNININPESNEAKVKVITN